MPTPTPSYRKYINAILLPFCNSSKVNKSKMEAGWGMTLLLFRKKTFMFVYFTGLYGQITLQGAGESLFSKVQWRTFHFHSTMMKGKEAMLCNKLMLPVQFELFSSALLSDFIVLLPMKCREITTFYIL